MDHPSGLPRRPRKRSSATPPDSRTDRWKSARSMDPRTTAACYVIERRRESKPSGAAPVGASLMASERSLPLDDRLGNAAPRSVARLCRTSEIEKRVPYHPMQGRECRYNSRRWRGYKASSQPAQEPGAVSLHTAFTLYFLNPCVITMLIHQVRNYGPSVAESQTSCRNHDSTGRSYCIQ